MELYLESHKQSAVLLETIRATVELEERKAAFRLPMDKAVAALVEVLHSNTQRVVGAALRTACRIVRISPEVAFPMVERFTHYAHCQNKSLVLMSVSALLRISELKSLPNLLSLLEYTIPSANEDLVVECLKGFCCALKKFPELEHTFTRYLRSFWVANNSEGTHSQMLAVIAELISVSGKHRERVVQMLTDFLNTTTAAKTRSEVLGV